MTGSHKNSHSDAFSSASGKSSTRRRNSHRYTVSLSTGGSVTYSLKRYHSLDAGRNPCMHGLNGRCRSFPFLCMLCLYVTYHILEFGKDKFPVVVVFWEIEEVVLRGEKGDVN